MTFTLDAPSDVLANEAAGRHKSPEILRTLVVKTRDSGDAMRFARVVSAMVNDTKMSLTSMTVGDTVAYPVAVTELPDHDHRELRFRLRDTSLVLDGLLAEQIVSIVAQAAPVDSIRYEP